MDWDQTLRTMYHVTCSQPTDWKSLVETAKVGEMCSPAPSETITMVMQLALIEEQLKKMSTQRCASMTGNRSPSPRRVRFDERTHDRCQQGYDDRHDRYDTCDEGNSDHGHYDHIRDRRSSPNSYGDRSTSPDRRGKGREDNSRGSRGSGRGQFWRNQDRGDTWSQDRNSRDRGGSTGRSRSSQRGDQTPKQTTDNTKETCGKCGWQKHENFNDCHSVATSRCVVR